MTQPKKRLLLLFALALTLVLTMPTAFAAELSTAEGEGTAVSVSDGTILLRSQDGATGADIQSALSNADSGTIVQLEGSFELTSTLKLCSNVTLDAGEATITHSKSVDLMLNFSGVDNAVVQGGTWTASSASTRVAKFSKSKNSSLSGMTITGGAGESPAASVYVYSSTNITVENCTFKKCLDQALYANKSDNFTVANCTFRSTNGYAIHTYYSDNSVIVGNTISDTSGDGIYASYSNNGTCSGNTISATTAKDGLDMDSKTGESRSGNGIFLSHCETYYLGTSYKYQDTSYVGNTLSDSANYGVHLNLCDTVKINKLVSKVSGNDGVHISASDRTTVVSSTIQQSSKAGITTTPGKGDSPSYCQNSVFRNNKIDTCSTYGIWLNQSSNTKVVGNQITKSKGDGIHCSGGCDKVKIAGNTISNTTSSSGNGIGIYSCTNTNIGGKVTIGTTEYTKNTIKTVKKHGIYVSKSNKTTVQSSSITSPTKSGIYLTQSKNCTVSSNSIQKTGTQGIYVNQSNNASVKKNTVTNATGKSYQVNSSSDCTAKTVNVPTINKVTSSSTKVTGKVTKGDTAKIKVGDKYYTCKVKNTSFTSGKFSKQKKGTTLYLYEYSSGDNKTVTSFTVK